jgi:predicted O-methyltransferase YrrM
VIQRPEDNRETFEHIDTDTRERILTFIESMEAGNTLFLQQLEQEALDHDIPIIRTQTQSLIKFLLTLKRPAHILEVGTATGFSALFMLTYAPGKPALVTIERDEARYRKALENRQAALDAGELDDAARCEMLEGDAAEILSQMQAPEGEAGYDFIFMDAAKGQYINFLPDVLRLLAPGGLLLSDNIFKDGEILESRFAVKRRDRTIHKRMREYLTALTHNEALQTLLLQEGDGAAISIKKK